MILESSVRLPFRYAAGEVGSRFLAALRDGPRILATRCAACSRVLCPARSFCPRCGEAAADVLEVGPGGAVVAATELPGRATYGLVRIDGADGALLHRLLGPAGAFAPGARVSARFAGKRTGSILDIEGFEPEAGGRS